MLAASVAAMRGHSVILLERNGFTGKKLNITGKGRCNVTNCCETDGLMAGIPRGGRFLFSAFSLFSPKDVMELFEELGVPMKIERGRRVFPASDRAQDITGALRAMMKKSGVRVLQGRADSIKTEEGRVVSVSAGADAYPCDAAILATGGLSYPLTGSTGDGYLIASRLGHTITPTAPSIVPLECADEDIRGLSGLTLKNVRLRVADGKKPVFDELGELLFTHFGVSGPLSLSASAHMRGDCSRYALSIDLKPGLDAEKLEKRILSDFEKYKNRDIMNGLCDLLHKSMIPVIIDRIFLERSKKINSVTRAERLALISAIKAFGLSVSGTRPIDEAIVTSGGVSTKEIDPKTMSSKLFEGLFFAGEIIDCDGYTGGYNLQIAWSTGFAAGYYC